MTRLNKLPTALFIAILGLSLPACGATETEHDILIKTAGGEVIGELELEDMGESGTKVEIELQGLPQGLHAMHFHETGRCDAPDFKTAGGHFNPTGADHGMKMENGPHAGDMMNIMIEADGTGELELINERVNVMPGGLLPALMDADGAALIVHEKADDFKSQPSGAAGARIGCAVINQ